MLQNLHWADYTEWIQDWFSRSIYFVHKHTQKNPKTKQKNRFLKLCNKHKTRNPVDLTYHIDHTDLRDHTEHIDQTDHIDHTDYIDLTDYTDHIDLLDHTGHTNHIDHIDHIDLLILIDLTDLPYHTEPKVCAGVLGEAEPE